jgi:hypothetical protein
MSKIPRGGTNKVEGGVKDHPTNEGTVKEVKNEGTADGAINRSKSPNNNRHGRDKSIGR